MGVEHNAVLILIYSSIYHFNSEGRDRKNLNEREVKYNKEETPHKIM